MVSVSMYRLKWPNDLWVDELKLAGLLIEIQGDQDRTFVMLGLGLTYGRPHGVDAPTTSIPLKRQIVFGLINQTIGLSMLFFGG